MKKSDFAGWKEVFSFTFEQTVKQKAYIIFLIVFSVIALFSSTATTLFKINEEYKEDKPSIGNIVVYDNTGLDIDYSEAFTSKKYKNVPVVSNPSEPKEYYEKIMEDAKDDTVLIEIDFDEDEEVFNVLFTQGKNVSLSEIGKLEFSEEFCDFFELKRVEAVNITKEQRDHINAEIIKEVKKLSEDGEVVEKAKGDGISYTDYMIMLALLMVCMMMINISGNQIALSIVTEKSSRVLEYLVINVRPLALIVGKIVATIVTSSLQMITIVLCFMASPAIRNLVAPGIAKWLFGSYDTADISAEVAEEALASSIQIIHDIKVEFVLFAMVFIVLGIVFFGIIAGLLGAAVSKMDEMQESMSVFQLLLIVGCYADMALCVMEIMGSSSKAFVNVLSICPVTSPFLVPAYMLLGKMSWGLMLVSILVMLAAIALMFMLTANVYEAMIFYNGKVLKIKDIIALALLKKTQKKGDKNNEE